MASILWHERLKPPRVGYPAKLNKQARRDLVKEVTKNPTGTLIEIQTLSAGIGEPTQHSINQAFMVSGSAKVAFTGLWEHEEKYSLVW